MSGIVAALPAGAAGPPQAADDIRNNPWQRIGGLAHGGALETGPAPPGEDVRKLPFIRTWTP